MERTTSESAIAQVVTLSHDIEQLARQTERIASDAGYHGTELQVDALLSIAAEMRNLAKEAEAIR